MNTGVNTGEKNPTLPQKPQKKKKKGQGSPLFILYSPTPLAQSL